MSGTNDTPAKRYRYDPPTAAEVTSPWLTVAGVGLGVESMRAETLWSRLQAEPGNYLEAPDGPAGSLRNCLERARLFRGSVLRRALTHRSPDHRDLKEFIENYAIPMRIVGPGRNPEVEFERWVSAYDERVQFALHKVAGMGFHSVKAVSGFASDALASNAWNQLFDQFDEAPDRNCTLLVAEDGHAIRSEFGKLRNEHEETLAQRLSRPKSPSDLSESFASLLFLRPASTLWLQELAPHTMDSQKLTVTSSGLRLRDSYGFGGFHNDGHKMGIENVRRPSTYATTSNVPSPWSRRQLQQYQDMPTYGQLHRPERADFADESNSLLPFEQRLAQLSGALDRMVRQALEGIAPSRVFYIAGCDAGASQRIRLLQQAMAQALPALQLHDPNVGYDLSQRLGEMGAASGAVAVGLAAVAGWLTGGTALVVEIRDDVAGAVLAFKPSPQEYRKKFVKPPYEDV